VGPVTLQAKLAAFDKHSRLAFDELLEWLHRDREALIHAARGRLVEGHYRFGDRLMYEYSQEELQAEACQEIADAINYLHLRVQRQRPQLLRGDAGDGHHEPEAEGPVA
jgi:hypothetical protein